jgi:predicted enzyme related to lactoylglutathione lyase
MTSRISHLSFDTLDPCSQSRFWSAVLGFVENPDDPNLPEHEECMIFSPDGGQRLLFIQVPDGKQLKNRLHLDIQPVGTTRELEVDRVTGLGAEPVADFTRRDGSGWITLTDPEGNEFCILSPTWEPTPFAAP